MIRQIRDNPDKKKKESYLPSSYAESPQRGTKLNFEQPRSLRNRKQAADENDQHCYDDDAISTVRQPSSPTAISQLTTPSHGTSSIIQAYGRL